MLYADDFMLHMKWLLSKYWDCRITLTLPIERCSRSGPTAANSKPSFWCRHDTIAVVPQSGRKKKILKIAIWLSSCNWSSSICSFRLWSFCLRLASVVLQLTETTWILGLLPEVLRKLHSCAMSYRLKRAGAVTIPQHLCWAIAGAPSAILSSVPLSHKFIVFLTTSRARCRRKKNGPTIWNDVVLRATLLRSGGEGPWSAAPVELASTPKGEPKAKNIYIE